MTPFTWFNWHEPLITPAQGAWTFLGFLGIYAVLKVVAWFLREPSPEMHEHVDAEGR